MAAASTSVQGTLPSGPSSPPVNQGIPFGINNQRGLVGRRDLSHEVRNRPPISTFPPGVPRHNSPDISGAERPATREYGKNKYVNPEYPARPRDHSAGA